MSQKTTPTSHIFVAFLRGINVGGNHKVPMAELKTFFEDMGFTDISTLLNTGNIIFTAKTDKSEAVRVQIESCLSELYKFKIPVLIRTEKQIKNIVDSNPFDTVLLSKAIKLYVTFVQHIANQIDLPYQSKDSSFQILKINDNAIFSFVDTSISQSTDAMLFLEKTFGKNCTTRNWNTLVKIDTLMK
jgi:uncharacterized protein (DUF1697 family)